MREGKWVRFAQVWGLRDGCHPHFPLLSAGRSAAGPEYPKVTLVPWEGALPVGVGRTHELQSVTDG